MSRPVAHLPSLIFTWSTRHPWYSKQPVSMTAGNGPERFRSSVRCPGPVLCRLPFELPSRLSRDHHGLLGSLRGPLSLSFCAPEEWVSLTV